MNPLVPRGHILFFVSPKKSMQKKGDWGEDRYCYAQRASYAYNSPQTPHWWVKDGFVRVSRLCGSCIRLQERKVLVGRGTVLLRR